MHWAHPLIGLPWSKAGDGPAAYSCWNFVRLCVWLDQEIEMPMIAEQSDENVNALTGACHAKGWRLVTEGQPPKAGDIVLMRNRIGLRHVGYMVNANGGERVIHCDGYEDEAGRAHGSVISQTLKQATSTGYSHYEFWRRA